MKRIILALDGIEIDDAKRIVEKTKDEIWGVKFNDLLLKYGISIISEFSTMTNVMADPKLFDIPKTIINNLKTLINSKAKIITVHCSAYFNPEEEHYPEFSDYIAGISVITSFNEGMSYDIYNRGIYATVEYFIALSEDFNYKYIVCSGKELSLLHSRNSTLKAIIPGIRPKWYQIKGDQKRTIAPNEAIQQGAEFLVMGRGLGIVPNFDIQNIIDSIKRTNDEICP
jgi:orotidine-5'-phosphate decarboxylase